MGCSGVVKWHGGVLSLLVFRERERVGERKRGFFLSFNGCFC